MIYYLLRALAFIILKLCFRFKICGRRFIPKKGGFILASNHVSYIDPVAVGAACPRRLNYMAKRDLFSNRFLGWLLKKVGSFPVKRGSADFFALKESMRRVKNGGGMLLFPEGTRQEAGEGLGRPEPGVGFLAAKLGVPVIPAFVKGTDKAMPKGSRFPQPSQVAVSFGEEIHIERGLPYQDIAESIMEKIRQLSC